MGPAFLTMWLAVMLCLVGCNHRTEVSLTSTSPDGRSRVEMVELGGMDRNFILRLQRDGSVTNIFLSPDEASREAERIIWSKDSDRMLLIGRNFVVREHATLPDGEQLYLLYNLNSRELNCNAIQQDRYPNFSAKDIAGISWATDIQAGSAANAGQPIRSDTNSTSDAPVSDH